MTLIRPLVATFSAVLFLAGCGPTDAAPQAPRHCLKLSMPDANLTTSAPSKVSLFFTVDTCSGEPVSGLSSEAFSLLEDDKPVSIYESQRTIQPKGQRYRMYSLVLLDLSGSILQSGSFDALADAAKLYVDNVLGTGDDGQKVALYSFDGRAAPQAVMDFSSDATALKSAIDGLKTPQCITNAECAGFPDRRSCSGWMCVDNSTNLNGAVVSGLERLEREMEVETGIPFKDSALVLFTDGTDQAGRVPKDVARSEVKGSKAHVFTIGLGGEVDQDTLEDFGKDGFERAQDAAQLQSAFKAIAARVLGMASRFYLLEYCSPKRGGEHELTVQVRATQAEGELEGRFSAKFDATGFASGCEVAQPTLATP